MEQDVVMMRDKDGWIVAEVPELPGCISQAGAKQRRWQTFRKLSLRSSGRKSKRTTREAPSSSFAFPQGPQGLKPLRSEGFLGTTKLLP